MLLFVAGAICGEVAGAVFGEVAMFFLVAQYFVTGGNFLREVGSACVLQYSQILSLFYRACSA